MAGVEGEELLTPFRFTMTPCRGQMESTLDQLEAAKDSNLTYLSLMNDSKKGK